MGTETTQQKGLKFKKYEKMNCKEVKKPRKLKYIWRH